MLMAMVLPTMVACGDNDDPEVDINSYVIGKWHSSYAEVYNNGQRNSVEINKTGEFASVYIEMSFKKDGTCLLGGWQQDSNGLLKWYEEEGKYSIKGDMVDVTDSDGYTISMVFDNKQKTLCIHTITTVNNTQVTVNLYLTK